MTAARGPAPQEDRRREDPQRDFDCRHYDDCLDRAVREAWDGFSCVACPLAGRAQAETLHAREFVRRANESADRREPASQARQAAKLTLTPHLRRVLEACPAEGTWTAAGLAPSLGLTRPQAGHALSVLYRLGAISRPSYGCYAHTQAGEAQA